MIRSMARPGLSASATALIFVLVLASQTVGAQWSKPFAVASIGDPYAEDLVVLDDEHLIATFITGDLETTRYFLRRSSDGGRTWRPTVEIASWPDLVSISGQGSRVDLVEAFDPRSGPESGQVFYRRSTNYGKSFSAPMAISSKGKIESFDVVAGPDGAVGVWWRVRSGSAYIRLSLDGGQTFGETRRIGSPIDGDYLDVAIGDGVVYVSYETSPYKLRLIRSFDLGKSWSGAVTISEVGSYASLAAEGDRTYIAFTDWFESGNAKFMTVKYRGTDDRGASWSPAATLVRNELDANYPHVVLRDGIVHATYARCRPSWDSCDDTRTMYRRSGDRTSWSQQVRISSVTEAVIAEAWPAAIGAGDRRVFVLYTDCRSGPINNNDWRCRVFITSTAPGR